MKTLLLLAVLLCSCTSEEKARTTLESSGFTEIELTGWDWFKCSDSDSTSTGFKATNPLGKKVEGTVCCGWTKGCTVRF